MVDNTGMFAVYPGEPSPTRNAPGRNRTCDLALRRRALYPLSYGRRETAV